MFSPKFVDDVVVLTNFVFFPATLLSSIPQSVPLNLQRSLRLGIAQALLGWYVAGNTCVNRHVVERYVFTVLSVGLLSRWHGRCHVARYDKLSGIVFPTLLLWPTVAHRAPPSPPSLSPGLSPRGVHEIGVGGLMKLILFAMSLLTGKGAAT